tara:strand:+ start:57 stop:491 length:435 start_codon:yes stop_codon:yes gene_type:complete
MIPIYRAKTEAQKQNNETNSLRLIDGVWYIIGFYSNGYISADINDRAILASYNDLQKVDKSTLSVHFPDMLDSEDEPIFASLSKDGKGGDIIRWHGSDENIWTAIYHEASLQWMSKADLRFNPLGRVEYVRIQPAYEIVIGIQK